MPRIVNSGFTGNIVPSSVILSPIFQPYFVRQRHIHQRSGAIPLPRHRLIRWNNLVGGHEEDHESSKQEHKRIAR